MGRGHNWWSWHACDLGDVLHLCGGQTGRGLNAAVLAHDDFADRDTRGQRLWEVEFAARRRQGADNVGALPHLRKTVKRVEARQCGHPASCIRFIARQFGHHCAIGPGNSNSALSLTQHRDSKAQGHQ